MRTRWLALTLAIALSLAVLPACQPGGGGGGGGGGNEEIGAVSVMGVWGGTELASFQKVAQKWQDDTGGEMRFEGTRDLSPILRARIEGGNPPDIAILPNPALLQQFGRAGNLKPLDAVLDMNQFKQDFDQNWIDQASVDGKLYGVFVRASTKSTVWYNPKAFQASQLTTPGTYAELTTLADNIKSKGGPAPWAMGMEAGGASGWPGSDWIQQLVLSEQGPDVYDQWVAHEIPWTDPRIKTAFQKFGQVALTQGNVAGGASAIQSTNFQDASYLPFQPEPRGRMYFLGAFVQGFLAGQFPDLKPVEDYDFFPFPAIDQQYQGAQTVGGDVAVMLNDTPSARSFMQFLAQGGSWEGWAKEGGFATPNKSLGATAYPDPLAAKAAMQLTNPPGIIRYDADDLMPAELQAAEWKAVLNYLQRPDNLDSILADLESTAKDAYANQQQQQSQPGTGTTETQPATETTP